MRRRVIRWWPTPKQLFDTAAALKSGKSIASTQFLLRERKPTRLHINLDENSADLRFDARGNLIRNPIIRMIDSGKLQSAIQSVQTSSNCNRVRVHLVIAEVKDDEERDEALKTLKNANVSWSLGHRIEFDPLSSDGDEAQNIPPKTWYNRPTFSNWHALQLLEMDQRERKFPVTLYWDPFGTRAVYVKSTQKDKSELTACVVDRVDMLRLWGRLIVSPMPNERPDLSLIRIDPNIKLQMHRMAQLLRDRTPEGNEKLKSFIPPL